MKQILLVAALFVAGTTISNAKAKVIGTGGLIVKPNGDRQYCPTYDKDKICAVLTNLTQPESNTYSVGDAVRVETEDGVILEEGTVAQSNSEEVGVIIER